MVARKLPGGLANARSLFSSYKWIARKKGRDWEIDFPTFVSITSSNCYLCQSPPAQIKAGGRRHGPYVYNGVDRVDNTKGYILGNVMPCCKACNTLKGEKPLPEIFKHLQKIMGRSLEEIEREVSRYLRAKGSS